MICLGSLMLEIRSLETRIKPNPGLRSNSHSVGLVYSGLLPNSMAHFKVVLSVTEYLLVRHHSYEEQHAFQMLTSNLGYSVGRESNVGWSTTQDN
eukprot:4462570-Heterocapsa_arctica.AAC.1